LIVVGFESEPQSLLINNPLGPPKMTPTPFPYWLEDPSSERAHLKSLGSGWGRSNESSTMKLAYT